MRRNAYVWLLSLATLCTVIAAVMVGYVLFIGTGLAWVGLLILALLWAVAGLGFIGAATSRRSTALRREMENWRAIGDALPIACVAVDGRGRGRYWNRHFETMMPDMSHAPLAAIKQRLGGTEDASELIASLADAAEGGTGLAREAMWRPVANGDQGSGDQGSSEPEWVQIGVAPLKGIGHHVLWTVQDVTSRRRLHEQLKASEGRLDDFLNHAPAGFYEADSDGTLTYMNETLAGWLGLTAADAVEDRRKLHDLMAAPPPKGTPPYQPFLRRSDADRTEVQFMGQAGVDGEARSFAARVSQKLSEESNLTSGEARREGTTARAVVANLTEEKQIADALRLANNRFRSFFVETPTPIALLDRDGTVGEFNRAWRGAMTASEPLLDPLVEPPKGDDRAGNGADKSAPAEVSEWQNIVEADQEKFREWLDQAIAVPGVHAPLTVGLVQAVGEETGSPATFYVARIEDEGGQLSGLLLQLHDVPSASAPQFSQGQKMQAVGQLAGGVAHDFNNLLTAMIGFCDLLLARHSPGDPDFGDIMQVKQNANRAANLVRQLLAFSRQQTMRPKVLNVINVVADLDNLLRRLIGADVRLDMVHGRDLGLVRVDQGQL
ncbi:MAG: hypothetical protein O7C63_02145, partial [Alphaproteobacteria bacterium]|nr:hypothetical protein [Alphaproteobacteria bacterium]